MIEKYSAQSVHYLQNALGSLEAGDTAKASEFLWGSVAEALKAVATSKGTKLEKHWEIGNYAEKLAKELGDESISAVFWHAHSLHRNFYEGEIGIEDVQIYAREIRTMVGKLLDLIPTEEGNPGS